MKTVDDCGLPAKHAPRLKRVVQEALHSHRPFGAMKMEQTLICTDNFPFDGVGLGRIGAEGTRKSVISVGETMIW